MDVCSGIEVASTFDKQIQTDLFTKYELMLQILLVGRPELVLYKVATVRTKYFVVNIHPHLFNRILHQFD